MGSRWGAPDCILLPSDLKSLWASCVAPACGTLEEAFAATRSRSDFFIQFDYDGGGTNPVSVAALLWLAAHHVVTIGEQSNTKEGLKAVSAAGVSTLCRQLMLRAVRGWEIWAWSNAQTKLSASSMNGNIMRTALGNARAIDPCLHAELAKRASHQQVASVWREDAGGHSIGQGAKTTRFRHIFHFVAETRNQGFLQGRVHHTQCAESIGCHLSCVVRCVHAPVRMLSIIHTTGPIARHI